MTQLLSGQSLPLCGTCKWGVLKPETLDMVECHGAPPTPVVLGVSRDALGREGPYVQPMWPGMPTKQPGCSLHAVKLALVQ